MIMDDDHRHDNDHCHHYVMIMIIIIMIVMITIIVCHKTKANNTKKKNNQSFHSINITFHLLVTFVFHHWTFLTHEPFHWIVLVWLIWILKSLWVRPTCHLTLHCTTLHLTLHLPLRPHYTTLHTTTTTTTTEPKQFAVCGFSVRVCRWVWERPKKQKKTTLCLHTTNKTKHIARTTYYDMQNHSLVGFYPKNKKWDSPPFPFPWQ